PAQASTCRARISATRNLSSNAGGPEVADTSPGDSHGAARPLPLTSGEGEGGTGSELRPFPRCWKRSIIACRPPAAGRLGAWEENAGRRPAVAESQSRVALAAATTC